MGPGQGNFWPRGHNLNNLSRSPLDEATYHISNIWAFWFQSRRILKVFPMLVYVKHVGPWARPFLWPKDYNLNNLGRGLLGEAEYQISKTLAFWLQSRRFLKVFPMLVYVKHVGSGRGQLWPQGYNLNKLARGLLDEATYQISKTWAFWF